MVYKYVLFAVLNLYINQGLSIRCYVCNTLTDDRCMNVSRSTPAFTCTVETVTTNSSELEFYIKQFNIKFNGFLCGKVVRKAVDKQTVIRNCIPSPVRRFDYCKQTNAPNVLGVMKYCGTCDTDFCNGSSALVPSATLFLLTTLTLFTIMGPP